MDHQMTTAAPVTAGSGGDISNETFCQRVEYHKRSLRQSNLCTSIAMCDPQDAAQIMAAALEDISAGAPINSFNEVRADAEFWSEIATPFELEAYFGSSLKRISRAALGVTARKRLILKLWRSFGEIDRQAFVRHIDPYGRFSKGEIS